MMPMKRIRGPAHAARGERRSFWMRAFMSGSWREDAAGGGDGEDAEGDDEIEGEGEGADEAHGDETVETCGDE
jgi:hypothetical protein